MGQRRRGGLRGERDLGRVQGRLFAALLVNGVAQPHPFSQMVTPAPQGTTDRRRGTLVRPGGFGGRFHDKEGGTLGFSIFITRLKAGDTMDAAVGAAFPGLWQNMREWKSVAALQFIGILNDQSVESGTGHKSGDTSGGALRQLRGAAGGGLARCPASCAFRPPAFRTAFLSYDPALTSAAAITDKIAGLGYKALAVSESAAKPKIWPARSLSGKIHVPKSSWSPGGHRFLCWAAFLISLLIR